MARFSIPNNQRMNPPWAADTLDSSKILPGGAKIDNSPAVLALMTAFLSGATIGGQTSLKPRIQSGTVVARNIGQPAMNLPRTNPGFGSIAVQGTAAAPATGGVPLSQPPATALAATTPPATATPLAKPTTGTGPVIPNRDTVVTTTGNTQLTPGAFLPLIPALFSIVPPTFLDPLSFELYIVAFEVPDLSLNGDCELVRWGTLIYENMLPFVLFPQEFFGAGWSAANVAGILQHLRVRYQTITLRDPATP